MLWKLCTQIIKRMNYIENIWLLYLCVSYKKRWFINWKFWEKKDINELKSGIDEDRRLIKRRTKGSMSSSVGGIKTNDKWTCQEGQNWPSFSML